MITSAPISPPVSNVVADRDLLVEQRAHAFVHAFVAAAEQQHGVEIACQPLGRRLREPAALGVSRMRRFGSKRATRLDAA